MPEQPTTAPAGRQIGVQPEDVLLDLIRIGVFQIDESGRVWRHMIGRRGTYHPCKSRRAESGKEGKYLQVRIMIDGHRYNVLAHRLVWRYQGKPIPEGEEVNHDNGIKSDNKPGNLECMTRSENVKHAHRTGLIDQRGQRNPAAKLSDDQVSEIRRLYAAGGITMQELADRFGVRFQHISRLIRGQRRASQLGPVTKHDLRHNACDRDPLTGKFFRKA
jgi:hypothetical protein